MTYFLAENPWYLAGLLGLVGAGFLIALRVTQDGRYLTRALIALGLAAGVIVVEQVWVTDAERVEWVVKDLIAALGRSDADAMLAQLDSRVTFGVRNDIRGEEIDTGAIRDFLKDVSFDWVHLSRLSTGAGAQTRRGSAEFRVGVAGTYHLGFGDRNFAGNSDWSLGFRKLPTGEWKITRITAVVLPPYAVLPLIRFRSRGGPDAARSSRPEPAGPPPPGDRRGRRPVP